MMRSCGNNGLFVRQ